MAKISVIVPTYNRPEVLPRAIDSILNQTFGDFDVHIIDGGSTDDTRDVVEQYADDRVIYHRQDNDKGLSGARNIGLRFARGELIGFLDDDDEWHPTKLEKQLSRFDDSRSRLGLVYTGSRRVRNQRTSSEFIPTQNGWVSKEIYRRNFVPSETPLVRASCFDEVGDFDVSLPAREDWDMWIRIAQEYKFDYVPQILATAHLGRSDRMSDDSKITYIGYQRILEKYREDFMSDPVAFSRIQKRIGVALFKQGDSRCKDYFRRAYRYDKQCYKCLLWNLVWFLPFSRSIYRLYRD